MAEKKHWFKRKRYGWGWTPATWQGWIVTALYLLFVTFSFFLIDFNSPRAEDALVPFFLFVFAATLILFGICYYKGEKPRWQWGERRED